MPPFANNSWRAAASVQPPALKAAQLDAAPRRHEQRLNLDWSYSEAVLIRVRAHPRASRERWAWDGSTLEVWVRAAPVEGAANAALLPLLARALGVHKSAIHLISGHRSRDKVFQVEGGPERTKE